MREWPAAGTKFPCWCGKEATVPFRPPAGPLDQSPPAAICLSGHVNLLSGRDVDVPDDPATEVPDAFVAKMEEALRARGLIVVPVGTSLDDVETRVIVATLRRFRSRGLDEIARILGIGYKTLWMRRRAYVERGILLAEEAPAPPHASS